jgi:hypothetical protein
VPIPAPLKVKVVPFPSADGLTVPDNEYVGVPPVGTGSTSQIVRLNRSPVGEVSLIVTVVPLRGVTLLCL